MWKLWSRFMLAKLLRSPDMLLARMYEVKCTHAVSLGLAGIVPCSIAG